MTRRAKDEVAACPWEAEVEVTRCPKHGGVLADCPVVDDPGTVGEAMTRTLAGLAEGEAK